MTKIPNRTAIADYVPVLGHGLEIFDQVNAGNTDGGILVYVHLPKAAGNSSIVVLRDHFDPYVSVDWRKPKAHLDEIVANWKDNPVRFVSGHVNHVALQALRASSLPHACVTFLRHPVERIISVYRYGTSAKSPMQEVNLGRYPTLEHFVFKVVNTNEISRFLLGKNVRSLEEYKEGMKQFAFVGVCELLPFSHLVLCRLLDIPFAYPGQSNVTENSRISASPPQEVLDHLHATQHMDIMYHSHVLKQFCQLSSELIGGPQAGAAIAPHAAIA